MAVYKPRTVGGIADRLARDVFVSSKLLRKAIDRDKKIQQLSVIPGQYADRYEALRQATEAAVSEHGADSRKLVPGTRLQVRSAQRIFGGGGNFRQHKRFLEQLMPEMKESHELGHKNISVLRGNIALALRGMDRNDPRRPHLKAVFETVKELDKITKEEDIAKVDINYLLDQVQKTATQEREYTVSWEKDVDLLTGVGGAIELEYEPVGLNQAKGKVAAFLGEIFKDIVQEESKRAIKLFENIDITELKGSPTIVDDVLEVITEAVDPKRKPKRRKTKARPKKKKLAASGYTKARKRKLKAVNQRRKSVASSPLNLVVLINKELPDTVRKNMQAPGLVNRTGRFADSVKITDVAQTPQGYPSIGYTYQRDPYEVFEMGTGNVRATPERDPRVLIDKSIREIAAQFALGRFYTRRV